MLSPLYGQLSPLRVPTTAVRAPVSDSDAEAYLVAVETADAMQLEQSVADAINSFVIGCKSDGIWSAIKASCILAGARTLSGALVPLIGTAPTNVNFVNADYSRKTGLLGNGSTKSLDSNRNNNSDPQNSNHMAAYHAGTGASDAAAIIMGLPGISSTGNNLLSSRGTRSRNSNSNTGFSNAAGFTGMSRSSASEYQRRNNNTTSIITITSQTPQNSLIHLYRSGTTGYSSHRISYYSIGQSLDLAKLDTRVSTLMTDLAAAAI